MAILKNSECNKFLEKKWGPKGSKRNWTWIGGYKPSNGTTWKWMDGKNITRSNWHPIASKENVEEFQCINLRDFYEWEKNWEAKNCDSGYFENFLCEYPVERKCTISKILPYV